MPGRRSRAVRRAPPVAGDVEKHLLHVRPSVAIEQIRGAARDRRCGPASSSEHACTGVRPPPCCGRRAGSCSRFPRGSARASVRTRSPVSGSRLAVGSSSSSTSGRLISDFASATRVFWPAESVPGGPVQAIPPGRARSASSPIRRSRPRHVIEMAVDAQVLGDRKPVRERRRRARRNSCGRAPRTGPWPCRGREPGWSRPSGSAARAASRCVVVLPAPLPPSRPTVWPASTVKPIRSTASVSP